MVKDDLKYLSQEFGNKLLHLVKLKGFYPLYERALRIFSEDYILSIKDLALWNEKTVHQKCIKFLMTEIFKYLNELSPNLLNEVSKVKIKLP